MTSDLPVMSALLDTKRWRGAALGVEWLPIAAGLLLLIPPTRAVARPALTAMAARRMPLITVAATAAGRAGAGRAGTGRGDYIDGEVIDVVDSDIVDVTDVEPQALPPKPD